MNRYRGRLAPSPTGLLHLGHARTFWMAYERARADQSAGGGILVLRDEDLDTQRARADYAAAMLEDLRWLGIDWQEGPDVGGAFGPYRQSERYALYRAAWEHLRAGGWIYPCTCSRRELAAVSAPHEDESARSGARHDDDDETMYSGRCRPAAGAVAQAREPAGVNWRFRIPEGRREDGRIPDGEAIAFEDSGVGARSYVAGRDFGDFVVWRRDDVPAYQLACVVDDAAMRITEVVRGADLLKSTARQILLYRALGLTPPLWHHCPLLRDAAGQRLAKRSDALSLRALRERGLTPAEVRAMWQTGDGLHD
jgi:glutamyl/glutaminyl-tRNA synthetase